MVNGFGFIYIRITFSNTVKLLKVKRLPNRIRVRHDDTHSNFFIIFVFFFLKSSVRFDRNEL
jgi:hypothetical protein